MTFAYAYKTSDGVRHEASMDAGSRDAVFAALRSKGIRPIKVVAADGSKANGETRFITRKRVVAGALCAGLAAGIVVAIALPGLKSGIDRIGRYRPGMEEKLVALRASAEALVADHARRMEAAGVTALTDYAAVFSNANAAACVRAIQGGYGELNVSRQKARDIFRRLYDIFPPDCVNERTDAQRLYGEAMDELDRSEARLVRDEKAYRLLAANRGKWTVKSGEVLFSDDDLAKEFGFLRRGLDPAETRWSRDFGK